MVLFDRMSPSVDGVLARMMSVCGVGKREKPTFVHWKSYVRTGAGVDV